jgi:hypothetical protein
MSAYRKLPTESGQSPRSPIAVIPELMNWHVTDRPLAAFAARFRKVARFPSPAGTYDRDSSAIRTSQSFATISRNRFTEA